MGSIQQPPPRAIHRYSADSFLVECPNEEPANLLVAIDRSLGGSTEAHCGEVAVLVRFDPNQTDADTLARALAELPAIATESNLDKLTLRIRYDGPDLGDVAAATGLSVADVIELHSSATYRVAFSGFSPGFAYLVGLPAELHLPRRRSPRPKVPAGSLAIAAHYCAIYPSASPGGWHLLGTSNAELFNPNRNPPALLRPGTSIKFEPTP